MAHLGDKLAEFFYEELSATEMSEARRHVESCGDCRLQVEQFERTHLALKAVPDLAPPRRIVFSAPEPRSWFSRFDWRAAAVAGAAAAVLAGVVIRLVPVPAPVNVSMPAAAPVVVQSDKNDKIDYERIINEVRQSDRVWLADELDKRDKEIQRLQGELAYYENRQRAVMKETMENASSIQLLAARR